MIALILGGARSGKSRRALEFSGVTPPNSFFIATAEAMDDEMSLRIQQHLMERGEQWQTIESPIELVNTLISIDTPETTIVVDCLTVWLGNLMHYQVDVESKIGTLLKFLGNAKADIRLVSNELGLGLVPETPMGREFRDLQGRLNQDVAALADRVEFMVAGIPLVVKPQGGQ